jgi:DNA polymerase III epsilon subunit family exonuclease
MGWFSPLWRRQRAREARSLESLLTEGFVALDLETTGLDSRRDAIVELAAVPFMDGRAGPGYVTHVNPGRPIPPESSRVHGITDAMVDLAPSITRVLERLESVVGRHILVGHGIAFDLAVLNRERRTRGLAPLTNTAIDTMRLAAALHPEWERFDFEGIASRVGIGILGRHTAEGDARAAGEILIALLPEMRARGAKEVEELIWLQETLPGFG